MWLSIATETTLDDQLLTVIQMEYLMLAIPALWRLETQGHCQDDTVSSRGLEHRVRLCLETNGGAGGNGSVSKVPTLEAWRPELASPAPIEKCHCDHSICHYRDETEADMASMSRKMMRSQISKRPCIKRSDGKQLWKIPCVNL